MIAKARIRVLALGLAAVGAIGTALAFIWLRPLDVRVAPIAENVAVRVFGLGTVEARVLSKVGFEVGAAITELNADHGDVVEQGQVLARLHASQQVAKVARAEAAVLSAEVAVKKADANIVKAQAILAQRLEVNKRKQELVSRQVTSTQAGEEAQRDEDVAKAELLVAKSDVEVARAQLSDARAQLAYEKAILEQHTLLAPYDALVVDRQKELGTVIKAGDPVFTLVATGSVWALAHIDALRRDQGRPACRGAPALPSARGLCSPRCARWDRERSRHGGAPRLCQMRAVPGPVPPGRAGGGPDHRRHAGNGQAGAGSGGHGL
jgi:HlyD family secretion protein